MIKKLLLQQVGQKKILILSNRVAVNVQNKRNIAKVLQEDDVMEMTNEEVESLKTNLLEDYLRSGLLLQGNFTSLFGKYGRIPKKSLKYFLKKKLKI